MTKRLTIRDIIAHKGAEPIVCLTAYSAPVAKIFDKHVDMLLVGDTVGMVLYGMESTLPVTVEMMIEHGKAVMRGSSHAFVVVDMPFGSYQVSPEEAFVSAAKIMAHTGCQAVKLEGGEEMAETIEYLVARGIPVMGHVGLMPQRVNAYGGYPAQGKTKDSKKQILADALAVQEAGAFSMVIEGVAESLAKDITKKVAVPTIGIGASVDCDGQVLVCEDMAGLFTEFTPKFVKRYANMADMLDKAAKAYADEVRKRVFPGKEHVFKG